MNFRISLRYAMTLAEVMIVFFVIGIVAAIISRSVNTLTIKTTNKYLTTAAFLNLQNAIAEIPRESDSKLTPTSTTLCTQLTDVMNVVGVPDCSKTVTAENVAAATANFVTTNGMRFYNFGTAVDANGNYIIYVDIDGKNRKTSIGWDVNTTDVIKLKINRSGLLLPFERTIAADHTDYLAATAYGVNGITKTMLKNSTNKSTLTYREAMCLTGQVPETDTFCSTAPAITTLTDCKSGGAYKSCEVVLSVPKGLRDFK